MGKVTNAPDVAKHLGITDNSALQGIPSVKIVKELDIIL